MGAHLPQPRQEAALRPARREGVLPQPQREGALQQPQREGALPRALLQSRRAGVLSAVPMALEISATVAKWCVAQRPWAFRRVHRFGAALEVVLNLGSSPLVQFSPFVLRATQRL